jgi:hypothetical protein
MSALNGDKSRFHRERKQKIARRKRNRELRKHLLMQGQSVDRPVGARPEAVAA